MDDEILFRLEDGVGLLTVNRPEARNALNWRARARFAALIASLASADGLRVVIITGAGDQAFVSGGDLNEVAKAPDMAAGERLNQVMSRALAGLAELPVPVIAAVNGEAIGGGCEIVTACDLRLAAAGTRFRFAQVAVGLTTGWGGTGRLVRLVGQSAAMELLLTGRTIAADEARDLGLIHRVAPPGESAVDEARRWAAELVALPREALAAAKHLVLAADRLPANELERLEQRLFLSLYHQPAHREALAAFMAKRRPRFPRT
jgi:enoyl-CoA hydratase/carnithine racemase